jgi:uncharacterized protein (TIGR03546 family)
MFFYRTLRRILAILNSDLTPNQVALGFCFGVVAGLVPWGWNTLFWLSLAFLTSSSFSATLLAFALFRVLAWLLLPVSYAVGEVLLDQAALEPLWSALTHAPILAWLKLNHYAVLGSYALALLFSVFAFFAVHGFVQKYRDSFFQYIERSRPWQALSRRERLFRIVQWLLLGGGVRFQRPRKRSPIFRYVRKPALIVVPLIYVIVYGAVALVAPLFVNEVVARGATLVIGGEVAVEQTTANALTGRLRLRGFSVQNPERPEEDVLRVREIAADLSLLNLTGRRVVFDELVIDEVFLNIRREADGSLNVDDLAEGPDLAPYFEWLREQAGRVDWVQLFEKYGETIWKRFVALLEPKPSPPNAPLLQDYKLLPARVPTFALRRLRIGRMHLRLVDEFLREGELPPVTAVDVIIENFAWRPEQGRGPITLGVKAYFGGSEGSFISFTAVFDERAEPPMRRYELQAQQIELAALDALYEHSLPVQVTQGTLSLSARLTLKGEALEGESTLVLVGAQIKSRSEDFSLLGFDPQTSRRVLDGINAYAKECPLALGLTITGTSDRPEFHWDEALLVIAKRGLLRLGTLPFAPIFSQIDGKLAELARLGVSAESLKSTLEDLLKQQLGTSGSDRCAVE